MTTDRYGYATTYTRTFWVVECCGCHIAFGVPEFFESERRDDHATFYCPSGHPNYYPQKSDKDKLRAARDAANARATALADQLEASERSARAYKGHVTRMRNRVAAGVCPVPGCQRTGLTQTMRHIASKHPDWLSEHARDFGVTQENGS